MKIKTSQSYNNNCHQNPSFLKVTMTTSTHSVDSSNRISLLRLCEINHQMVYHSKCLFSLCSSNRSVNKDIMRQHLPISQIKESFRQQYFMQHESLTQNLSLGKLQIFPCGTDNSMFLQNWQKFLNSRCCCQLLTICFDFALNS